MPGNSFGQIFRITTFGESHGAGIGVVIDGCPAGMMVDLEAIQIELDRRRPGQSQITTPRAEADRLQVLSGLFEGKTTGAPVTFWIANTNQQSGDYDHLRDAWRPGHADFTYDQKYGIRDHRGGGRSSARETAARVMAGALARQLLAANGINIIAFVSKVGPHELKKDISEILPEMVESNAVRCPDPETAKSMLHFIEELKSQGDTSGGIVTCRVTGVPPGLGEPVFNKLQADLASAMMSINAAKGFEIGSGFKSAEMKGSEFNDQFEAEIDPAGHPRFKTTGNHSGGIQGGISNGSDLYMNIAFKPVSTILQPQQSFDKHGNPILLEGKGRHDPCVVPRAVPVVEAMCALVLADHILRNRTSRI